MVPPAAAVAATRSASDSILRCRKGEMLNKLHQTWMYKVLVFFLEIIRQEWRINYFAPRAIASAQPWDYFSCHFLSDTGLRHSLDESLPSESALPATDLKGHCHFISIVLVCEKNWQQVVCRSETVLPYALLVNQGEVWIKILIPLLYLCISRINPVKRWKDF